MIKPLLYAACDEKYYHEHGESFIHSAEAHGHDCKLTVYASEPMNFSVQINSKILMIPHPTQYELANIEDIRTVYASLRFRTLPELLKKENRPILVLDVDSIIREEILFDENVDAGVFLRLNNTMGANEWEQLGMKVAAGALYVTPKALEFAEFIQKVCETEPRGRWFLDQRAIYEAYLVFKIHLNILDLSQENLLDWEFENGKIFTAKGNRKENEKYLAEKRKYV